MSLTHATRKLLDSIGRRTDARLRGAALLIALRHLDNDGLFRSGTDAFDLDAKLRRPPLETSAVIDALESQTGSLASDAWELLWSEFVDDLVEHQECEYNGLGRFRFDSDKGLVTFRADSTLVEAELTTVSGEESVWSVAMVATAEGAGIANLEGPLLAQPDDTVALSAVILGQIGRHSVHQAIERTTLDLAVETAVATAAFVSYQSVVLALGNRLREVERVHIPLIGTFSASLGVVSFDAAGELIDLLVANDRVSW